MASRWRTIRKRYKWWQLTLFTIGVLAALSVLGALFYRVGHAPEQITTDAPVPDVTTPRFAAALAQLTGASMDRGGTISALNNGDEFLPALLESIGSATRTINFSVYIWNDGQFSDPILAALTEKQRNGVAVRVLLDGLGSIAIPDEEFEPLKRAGGRVEKYRTPRFGQLTRFHRRNHRRAIVIDGDTGFTGGIAVADTWIGHAQDPDHWRDVMFKVTGPLARTLQAGFADTWASTSGEILVGPSFYPEETIDTDAGVERFVHLANSPADDDQSMAYFFLLPLLAARETAYLVSPYFIPDKPMLKVLTDKARAGVDVRLLLPGERTDNWLVRASSQDRYAMLMEAGVKIYEYQPTFLHAKFAVIDGRWSIVGSPNLNTRSRQLDEENAFGILDRELASTLHRTFFDDLTKAQQIDPDEWRGRNPAARLFQLMCRLLDDQS
jgi:cardiolipin synthase